MANFAKQLDTGSEGEAIHNRSGVFPGAFRGQILHTQPKHGDLGPISPAEAYEGIELRKAVAYPYEVAYIPFAALFNEASLYLITMDPSGAESDRFQSAVRQMYEHCLQVSARINPGELESFAQRLLTDGFNLVDKSELTPGRKPDAPDFEERSLVNKLQDTDLLIGLAQKAFTKALLESLSDKITSIVPGSTIDLMRSKDRTLRDELRMAEQHCYEQRLKKLDTDTASALLWSHSSAQRVIGFCEAFKHLENELSEASEKIRAGAKGWALFRPTVILASGSGTWFETSKNALSVSPADERALRDDSFLILTSFGIGFALIKYDYPRGALGCGNQLRHRDVVYEAMSSTNPNSYSFVELASLASRFMPPTEATIDALRKAVSGDDFASYVSDPSAWFGPRKLPEKEWLKGKGAEKMQKLCAEAHAALRDGTPFTGDLSPLIKLIPESLLQNAGGESLLFRIVEDCLKRGLALKDAAYKDRSKATTLIDSIARDARSPFVTQIFKANTDGTVGLHEFGVNYLLELIDPDYPHHRRGSDDPMVAEQNARRSQR